MLYFNIETYADSPARHSVSLIQFWFEGLYQMLNWAIIGINLHEYCKVRSFLL